MKYKKETNIEKAWNKSKESQLFDISVGIAFVLGAVSCFVLLHYLDLLK